MSYIEKTLKKRKVILEKKLKNLIKLHEHPYLSRATTAYVKSMKALQRYLDDTKDTNSYKWAGLWDKAKKHNLQICKKQNHESYSKKRVDLEIELREINTELYKFEIKRK